MRARYLLAAVAVVAIPAAAYAQSAGRDASGTCTTNDDGSLDCNIHVAAPETTTVTSSPGTSSPTTTVPVTTTTVPATTTTRPATTTVAATTTTSTTSSTTTPTSPPTTQPAAGVVFSEDFSDPSAFADRFVHDVGNYIDFQHHRTADYIAQGGATPRYTFGDHDAMCGNPATTSRTLDNADPNLDKYFWQCAPGDDPGKAHLMTGIDSTGYIVLSFAPKATFNNVTKVCWSINATEEGGGKWTNMIIVPDALYRQFAPRMDYVRFDFNNQNAPGDFNIQQADHPGTRFLGVTDFRGTQFVYNGDQEIDHPGGDTSHTTTDKAARYQHCVEKTGTTTARLTVARPTGGIDSYNVNVGGAWPTGPVHVIFQDEMYDPPKRELYDPSHVSWHWDDIQITGG